MKLQIEVDAADTIALIEQIRTDLSALKEIPKFPFDELLRLGDSLVSDLSVGSGCTTANASNGRVIVKVVGVLEVFAATVAALKLYVHAEIPQQS